MYPLFVLPPSPRSRLWLGGRGVGENCALSPWWFCCFVSKLSDPSKALHSPQLARFILTQSLPSGLPQTASCSLLTVLFCLLPCLILASPLVIAQNWFPGR